MLLKLIHKSKKERGKQDDSINKERDLWQRRTHMAEEENQFSKKCPLNSIHTKVHP